MLRQIEHLRRFLTFPPAFNAGAAVSRWLSHDIAVNAALRGVGFALAGLSLLFAVEMLRKPHEPYIPGLQYLAIFAQPNSSASKAARLPSPPAYGSSKTPNSVDYTSTASIPERKQKKEALGELATYEILGATQEVAWLRRGSEIVQVRRGDYVPGIGRILSIEERAGRWRLVVENAGPEAPSRGFEKKAVAKPPVLTPR
jgi:hypothetical protein